MPFASSPVLVGLNDQVEIRYPTPTTWNTKVLVNVQIGTGVDPDGILFGTRIPDATPDNFSFTDQVGYTNANGTGIVTTFQKNTFYYSDEILINGLEIEVPAVVTATVSGPKASLTGASALTATQAAFRITRGGVTGAWQTSGTVRQGDLVRLRCETENWYTTNHTVTLTVSDETWGTNVGNPAATRSDTWSITTRAQDHLINQYNFTDYVDAPASTFGTFYTQNITILGIDTDTIVRATSTGNVQVSKDNVNWSQSVTGLVLNNILYTRIAIGSTYTTKTTGTLNVFTVAGDTLVGGFENNTTGTYGSGVSAVTQSLGSVTDNWQVWTEVDRYPDSISIGPIFTPSIDRLDTPYPLANQLETVSVTSSTVLSGQANVTYSPIIPSNIVGIGQGASIQITRSSIGQITSAGITVLDGGTGYQIGDTLRILGSAVGGTNTTDDIVLTITATLDLQYWDPTEQIDKVVVSATDTFNYADPGKYYYSEFNISGLGTEYVTGTYDDAEAPISPGYLPALPLSTTSVNGSTVQIQCVVAQGNAQIRKNNTGGWVQTLYVQNGDLVTVRQVASTTFNATVSSEIRLLGPPNAGPNGNPTNGPTTPSFAETVRNFTLKTRTSRVKPLPVRAKDIWDALPATTYVTAVPIEGLDENTTATALTGSSSAGVNVQVSIDNVNFSTSVTVPSTATALFIRGTASSTSGFTREAKYRIGSGSDFIEDTWRITTKYPTHTYYQLDGGGLTNFIEYNLPDYVDQFYFYVIGAGGGNGGDDAPNSFGGQGGKGAIVRGIVSVPLSIQNNFSQRQLKLYAPANGQSGNGFDSYGSGDLLLEPNAGRGGAGGWGYSTGGNGGNAGLSDRSGGGGGGGGAAAITWGDGTVLAIAGGGGGAGGAGNDTRLPSSDQNGNYTGNPDIRTSLAGLNFTASSGSNNTTRGGGGGGAGGGLASTAGGLGVQKLDELGNIIQTIDLDAFGGTTGNSYYDPTYVTTLNVNSTTVSEGAASGEYGFIIVHYPPQDITPDAFAFPSVDNATPDTLYESIIVQITGITGGVPVSVSNGQIRVFPPNDPSTASATAWSSGGSVRNQGYIQVRFTTGSNYFTTYSTTATVGNVNAIFQVTTGEPPDTNPNSFSIPAKLNQPINTNIDSDIINVTGINVPVTITATGDGSPGDPLIAICTGGVCDAFAPSPRTIQNGQGFRIRKTSSPNYSTTTTVDVIVGTSSITTWQIETIDQPDETPVGFLFTSLFDQDLFTPVLSNTRTIQGISVPVTITVTGGASIIRNGIDVFNPVGNTASASFSNFDTIQLSYTTSNVVGEQKTFNVTAGTYTTTWIVTNTGVLGTNPNAFTFPTVLATDGGVFTDSNLVTISGLGAGVDVSISVSGSGLISVNGGAFLPTSSLPLVNNGDTIRVRLRSSLVDGFSVTTSVQVGSYETTFTVVTPAPAPDDVFGQYYSSPAVVKDAFGVTIKYNTKFDGMPVGSIMPVFKDNTQSDSWGISDDKLNGDAASRFPGWIYCDGKFVSPNDYPLLFETIGYTFGANGALEFRLPDMRNRKLLGTGALDGTAPSSPVVSPQYGPTKQSGTGSSTLPGSFGGMWFIDKIASPGIDELEQVETPATGQPAQDSQFFAIAQLKTTGYNSVQGQVEFQTIGSVSGAVGLSSTTIFDAPYHQHLLITGQADVGDFVGKIGWGREGGLRALDLGTPASPGEITGSSLINLWGYPVEVNSFTLIDDPSGNNSSSNTVVSTFPNAIGGSYWGREIGEYGLCEDPGFVGNFWDPNVNPGPFSDEVNCLFNFVFNVECGTPKDARVWGSITVNTPNSALIRSRVGQFINANAVPSVDRSGDNLLWLGALTIPRKTITIDKFTPTTKNSHTHYVSLTAITDTDTQFSYNNQAGAGTSTGGAPATSTVSVVFTAQDVGMEVFPGTFTLGLNKQLIPIPSFSPNDLVPLVTPYLKVRWMIKAY
jgi:hypothetical protein